MIIIKEQLSWLIILAGIIYSLYLFSQVAYGAFFNGDSGLKALLAKQLSSGKLRFDLIPSEEKWVKELWNQGLYPYEKPFVFCLNNRYYISFPFTFSLITAPFYKLFGYRGLYLIPVVSTWVVWITFNLICQSLNFNVINTNLGLIALIFASNLTLYSAMYWEHTLAIALCFAGMSFFFIPQMSIFNVIITGCLVGLSVWVRSEFFAMVGALTIVVILQAFSQNNLLAALTNSNNFNWQDLYLNLQVPVFYLISMFLVVGAFLVTNKIIYGYFLGLHSLLVLEEFSLSRRIEEFKIIIQFLTKSLIEYFPLTIFPIFYILLFGRENSPDLLNVNLMIAALVSIGIIITGFQFIKGGVRELKNQIKKWLIPLIATILWFYFMSKTSVEVNNQITIIYLICLFFVVGVSLLVDIAPDEFTVGGKQWGPRYLLILLPLISLMVIEQLQYFQNLSSTIFYYVTLFTVVSFVALGIYKNLYLGTKYINKNSKDIEPTIQFLAKNTDPVVAVSHQHAAQALEFSLPSKTLLFRAEESKDLLNLAQALLQKSLDKFIYICYPHRVCRPLTEATEKLQFSQNHQLFQIKLNNLGTYGKYPIYQGEIVEIN
ncbi:MAG: dolichol-phosphate mannosyltransferase [Okeania sp. SIO1H6]|nr:dolichol-phosphate mannosyltransferase [Okeania sp. SIO1H6]